MTASRSRPWRAGLLAVAILLVILFLLMVRACGGSPGTPVAATTSPQATTAASAAPTESAAPSAEATSEPGQATTDVAEAAGKLADLASYRFAVTFEVKGATTGDFRDGSVKMSGTVILKPSKALQFQLESSAPDQPGTFGLIAIGDDAWFDFGGGYQKVPAGQAGSLDQTFTAFEPETLFGQTYADYADQLNEVGSETKNGVETVHYTADASVLGALSSVYGIDGTWSMDLWLAKDGGYLVSATVTGSGKSGSETGEFGLAMDITNVNDPANSVEPPQ